MKTTDSLQADSSDGDGKPLPSVTSSHTVVTEDKLRRMEEKIFAKRPALKKIKEQSGSLTYFDYTHKMTRVNPNKNVRERQKEVVDGIKNEVQRLLGSTIADSVEKQLKKTDNVSTAEHSGPLGHPNVFTPALQQALPMYKNKDPRFQNVIVLSCSGVSFDTPSFPRGFPFHGFVNKVSDNRITFFGRTVDARPILYARPYDIEAIEEMKKRLQVIQKEAPMQKEYGEKIVNVLDELYAAPHPLTCNEYADQLTITNYWFFKKLFANYTKHMPNYISLSQEKVVLKLLTKYHITQDTVLNRILFNTQYHQMIEKHFDHIMGAFNNDKSYGTFLFWAIPKGEKYRIQLFREGNELVAKEGTYRLNLTPEAILQAIQNKELIPSLLLIFITLTFYYGLFVGGGFNQTSYLEEMKNAYIRMMQELGDSQSAQDAQFITTDDFIVIAPHLAFIDAFGTRIPATGMDMFLYQDPKVWPHIVEATKKISLEEITRPLIPYLYGRFCPDTEKEDELVQISRNDIEKYLGLDKKIPPLAAIS